ncbi:MAG: hypothetical protein KDK55_02060 [Chlamydiia bacterium]|nr:hypothetical protein [Chlamydiia bacterium]
MSYISHKKVFNERQLLQLSYAIDALSAYINAAVESQSLKTSSAENISKDVNALKNLIHDKAFVFDHGVKTLNRVINNLNEGLAQDVARYPDFSIDGPFSRIQAMNHILAFEQFLSEILKSKYLTFNKELPLFKQAYYLWKKVSHGEIKSDQAMAKLADLIRQVNGVLQEKNRYPIPDLSAYVQTN